MESAGLKAILELKMVNGLFAALYPESGAKLVRKTGLQPVIGVAELLKLGDV